MRRITIIIVFLFSSWIVHSQGIFHYYTGLILPDKDAPIKKDRLGFDIMYNSWVKTPDGIKVKPYSIGFNLFRIYDIPFGHSNFGIGIGYGLSSHNVHHNGYFNVIVNPTNNTSYTSLTPHAPDYQYRKNKVSMNYVEVPFEFRFRTKKKIKRVGEEESKTKGPFRFYPGFKVGYLVNMHTSVKDNDGKFKNYNFPNVDPIRYGATLRVGYKGLTFFGFYSLTNLFRKGRGDEKQAYSVGLSFLTF